MVGKRCELGPSGEQPIEIAGERARTELKLVPGSLLGGLWLQFARAIEGNRVYRECRECGRWFEFMDGGVRSGSGLHPKPDCKLMFKNARIGASLLMPPINWLNQINAQKDFVLTVEGSEDLTNWFAQTLMMGQTVGLKIGRRLEDGTMRYCNMTNGGPVFVYVKDGKIIRMTPIDLEETDGASWTIEARGMKFTPRSASPLANNRSRFQSWS